MIEFETNYCQIVAEGLAGRRAVDSRVLASAEVLRERLERLRSLGGPFADVEFSPQMAKLSRRRSAVAVM